MPPLTSLERLKLFKQRHPGYYREYDRERMRRKRLNNPEYVRKERAKAREYYHNHKKDQTEKNKKYRLNHNEKVNAWMRNYRKKHPDLTKARNIANYYVPLKGKCEICGSTQKLERHHPNYANPSQVITVCRKCHVKLTIRKQL